MAPATELTVAAPLPASEEATTPPASEANVPDPASVVQACAALVKPGGHVFFSTLNRNPKSYLLAVIGAEYILNMLPRGTHDWRKFVTPAELDVYLSPIGLVLTETRGVALNPLTLRWGLSGDVSTNYLQFHHKSK